MGLCPRNAERLDSHASTRTPRPQAGGYYDHVVPPSVGVPADDAPCHLTNATNPPGTPFKCPGGGQAFDFRRLGLRTTAMLISPWVTKGAVTG